MIYGWQTLISFSGHSQWKQWLWPTCGTGTKCEYYNKRKCCLEEHNKHSVVFLQVLHSRIVIIIITIIQHPSLLLSACQFPAGLNDSQSASALQKVQYLLTINLKEGKHLVIRDRSGTDLWLIQIFKLGWCWVLWFTRGIALLCLHNCIPLIINECVMLLVDHNISLIQLWILYRLALKV